MFAGPPGTAFPELVLASSACAAAAWVALRRSPGCARVASWGGEQRDLLPDFLAHLGGQGFNGADRVEDHRVLSLFCAHGGDLADEAEDLGAVFQGLRMRRWLTLAIVEYAS